MQNAQSGFTLIELMITVGIVAILAAIAYPSYRDQVLRSHRAEARSALLQTQVAQEKFFIQYNRYAKDDDELVNSPSNAKPGLGIPATTSNSYYTLKLTGDGTQYEIKATTANSQTNDKACQTLSIDNLGNQKAKTSSASDNATCWKK